MALDLLAIGLGGAVVKGACRIWLGDAGLAAEAGASVADLLRDRVAGALEHRRLVRQFDQLTDVVAEKVQPLLEQEFRGLPDNERRAAIEAVRDTFERAPLTERELFDVDLDPVYLDRYLRRQTGKVLGGALLSRDSEALYNLLLRESCAYLVEIYTQLPSFEAGGINEILRRQTLLADQVREVLDRLPDRDELGGHEGFTADYRRQVANKLDRVELFGVSVSEASRTYPLTIAYISLTTRTDEMVRAGGRAEEALADHRRAFVRGEAGSGKTTLLQWLAVRAARRDFPVQLTDWDGAVPFFVPLRSYAESGLPAPEELVRPTGRHLAGEMPDGWVHRLLREGRALMLVDGVDELPERRRADAREWLRDLVATFPDARYVVTSRPAAAGERWLHREGFAALELQPMGLSDIRAFIAHWHDAVRGDTPDAEERKQLDEYERRLVDAVDTQRHLRTLAMNPLVCALLCALHRERRTHLPRDRMEIYKAALDMLLERRDVERQVADDGIALSRIEKTLILQHLAYWLIRNGWSSVERARAVQRLEAYLTTLPGVAADAETVFRHLLVRSGLLREPTAGRVDFVHRTFQEYLAGKAATDNDDIGALVNNAHDDQWREVVIMAAGHARPAQRGELLRRVLDRGRSEDEHGHRLQLLAIGCLETSPQLDPSLRKDIEVAARGLLPPRSMETAEEIAAAGDLAIELIERHAPADRLERFEGWATATIRMASLVGGEAALRLIARFGGDARESVVNELLRAWRYFDPEEYARAVLADSPLLLGYAGEIDPSMLPALRHLRRLRHVGVNDVGRLDLAPLAGHPGLASIHLAGCDEELALDPLADVPQLEDVALIPTARLPDLTPLRGLPRLRRLRLGTGDPVDLTPLAGITDLEVEVLVREERHDEGNVYVSWTWVRPHLHG